ncbi:MAG: hypothetical protein JXN59_18355 [Anaerolineae bacterium]|nr:hypothetical protein [Anaerolineae bacterium]
MPYQVEWYEEPHIVFVKLSGKLTQEDFAGFGAELIALTSKVPEINVHTLVDVSEAKAFPPINVVVQETREMLAQYPNRDMSTAYGASPLVRFIIEALLKLTPLRIKLLDTHEEAIAFIHQMIELEKQKQENEGKDT